MGFSLGNVVHSVANAVGSVAPQTGFGLFGGNTGRPGSPNLPGAPTLQTPNLPNYPSLSPEEQALLKQRQDYLSQFQDYINKTQSNGVSDLELENYKNALSGNIAPNQMIAQQKQKDFDALKQRAGQLGVQIKGDTPESAASQSTAGNQMLLDFNKRYGALEQNYNLGQQQFGASTNLARMGFNQGAYNQLGQTATGIQQAYAEPRLGQFGVDTARATGNADIINQNLMNQYNQSYGQQMANYNNSLAGWQNQQQMISGLLGLGGTLGGAAIAGPWGAAAGKGVAGAVAPQPAATSGMGFGTSYPLPNQGGSYIQNYSGLANTYNPLRLS